MPSLYLDASALVKYYIAERGSGWVTRQLFSVWRPGDVFQQVVATTLLSNVEVVCALRRAHRSGRIAAAELGSTERRFLTDMRQRYQVLDADLDTTLRAVKLAERYPLRAYDAMHLSTALKATETLVKQGLPPCIFVSADAVLLTAARAEGLSTENPNDHDHDTV
jgi:predicted nucleic acid-binding protein